MAKNDPFSFDPAAIADFFNPEKYAAMFGAKGMPSLDPAGFMDTQKKNMDAFVAANKAASDAYQDLFRKQMAVFQQSITEAQKHVGDFDASSLSAEGMAKTSAVTKAAFEMALKNMQDLADETRKANETAFAAVSDKIQESAKNLESFAKSFAD